MNDAEAHPKVRIPKFPKELGPDVRKIWRTEGRRIVRLGLLTEIDTAVFAGYCYSLHQWLLTVEEIHRLEKSGEGGTLRLPFQRVGDKGYVQVLPHVSYERDKFEDLMKAAARLGLSPSDRSRIKAEKVGDEKIDLFADYKQQKGGRKA